jgi:hypothetical protein
MPRARAPMDLCKHIILFARLFWALTTTEHNFFRWLFTRFVHWRAASSPLSVLALGTFSRSLFAARARFFALDGVVFRRFSVRASAS